MTRLTDQLVLYRYPLAEQVRLLRSFEAIAAELGETEVKERAAAARDVAQAALERRQLRSREEGEKLWSPKVRQLDQAIDHNVTYIHGLLSTVASRSSHPHAAVARKVLASLFNPNLAAFVQIKFSEQSLLNQRLVDLLRGDAKPLVAAMGLAEAVDELEQQARTFAHELDVVFRGTTPKEVAEAEQEALEETLAVIHFIMGRYRPRDAAQRATRDRLLVPVVAVNEELHAMYRERTRVKKGKAGDGASKPATGGNVPVAG